MFKFGGDVILVRVNGNLVEFANTMFGAFMANIDGLKLSKEGALKEFPDLKDKEDWRSIAISRFKEKIASFPEESEKLTYVIEDLRKFGYKPIFRQKKGFRRVQIK